MTLKTCHAAYRSAQTQICKRLANSLKPLLEKLYRAKYTFFHILELLRPIRFNPGSGENGLYALSGK